MSDKNEGSTNLLEERRAPDIASILEETFRAITGGPRAEEVSTSDEPTNSAGPVEETPADLASLVEENNRLREELRRCRSTTAYGAWFNKTFAVDVPVPNTWPFTTFVVGTPWCDKVAHGMNDAEMLFAEHLLVKLASDGIAGSVVEFGTYYGHWLNVLASIQEKHGWRRDMWGFDSFEGLPAPRDGIDPTCWTQGMYAAPFDEVKLRLRMFTRPWLRLVKGWFKDTLFAGAAQSIDKIAYARIDGDLYESCVDCLRFLNGRLVDQAILVFDDWQQSCDLGETRAFKEWLEQGTPYRFEYLASNLWGHLYLRVHHVGTKQV
jgi:Macrocin-O-methyltransferase (TylF)